MDPIVTPLILVLGAFFGNAIIKALENQMASDTAGSIAISERTYEQRWSDPKYVDMIHKTIALEKEQDGVVLTECNCRIHKGPQPGPACGFNGCGAVECDRVCVKAPKPLPKKPMPPKGPGAVSNKSIPLIEKYNIFTAGGRTCRVPAHMAPKYAKAHYDPTLDVIVLKWYDPVSGKATGLKCIPSLEFEVAQYDYNDKPIMTKCHDPWCNKRTVDKYCAIHTKEQKKTDAFIDYKKALMYYDKKSDLEW